MRINNFSTKKNNTDRAETGLLNFKFQSTTTTIKIEILSLISDETNSSQRSSNSSEKQR